PRVQLDRPRISPLPLSVSLPIALPIVLMTVRILPLLLPPPPLFLFLALLASVAHRALLSSSSDGFAAGTISYPLTIERKLFHPASTTCTTCTTKNPQKPIVNQKCSHRAISYPPSSVVTQCTC